jgi:hypothetical protein
MAVNDDGVEVKIDDGIVVKASVMIMSDMVSTTELGAVQFHGQ